MPSKTNTVLFWVFLAMPAFISALIAGVPKEVADPLMVGSLLVWIVSSLYCGIFLGVKSSQSAGIRVLLSFVCIFAIGAINCFILAAGCSGKLSFH